MRNVQIVVACSLALIASATGPAGGAPEGWKLAWADEFKGERPDAETWTMTTGFLGENNELQHFTDRSKNVRIEDGVLVLEAHSETYEGAAFTSGRLVSRGKRETAYPRVEIRARMTKGLGTWAALRLLGANVEEAGWPACGEIDIMEHVGANPGVVHASIQSATLNHMNGTIKTKRLAVGDVSDTWRVYAAECLPDSIEFFVDEKAFFKVDRSGMRARDWPFDQEMFVTLNLAVGGFWGALEGVDKSAFPQRLEVDWVRVYEREKP